MFPNGSKRSPQSHEKFTQQRRNVDRLCQNGKYQLNEDSIYFDKHYNQSLICLYPQYWIEMLKKLTKWFSIFLHRYPLIVLIVSGLISATLTTISVHHFLQKPPDWNNPKLGFEARGTEMSGKLQTSHLMRTAHQMELRFPSQDPQIRRYPKPQQLSFPSLPDKTDEKRKISFYQQQTTTSSVESQPENVNQGPQRASGGHNIRGSSNIYQKVHEELTLAQEVEDIDREGAKQEEVSSTSLNTQQPELSSEVEEETEESNESTNSSESFEINLRSKRSLSFEKDPNSARKYIKLVCQSPMCSNLQPHKMFGQPVGALNAGLDGFSKAVFSVPSLDALFTVDTIRELCELDHYLGHLTTKFKQQAFEVSCFTHSWSLPNYMACYSGLNSCTKLEQSHIDLYYQQLKECSRYHELILDCKLADNCKDIFKHNVSRKCSDELISEPIWRLFSKNIFHSSSFDEIFGLNRQEIFVATFLPFLHFETYLYFGYQQNISSDLYDEALHSLQEYSKLSQHLTLVGCGFEVKLHQFDDALRNDVVWGCLAFVTVIGIIWAYSGSAIYMIAVAICLGFSVGTAYFTYTVAFGISFFPFMNLLVFVLLVGIGADDTFVLMYIFMKAKDEQKIIAEQKEQRHYQSSMSKSDQMELDLRQIRPESEMNSPRLDQSTTSVDQLPEQAMYDALSHAALSMFVTSATTAAAFYGNIVNDVVTIKCFGVFAGTTMLVNYWLVVTWLPAALVLYDRWFLPFWAMLCCRKSTKSAREADLSSNKQKCSLCGYFISFFKKLNHEWMPLVVDRLKYVFLGIFTIVIVLSVIAAGWKPGLELPQRNPIQIYKWSHPYEWYDDKAEIYFGFAGVKYQWPLHTTVVWGLLPRTDADLFNPSDFGEIHFNPLFKLSSFEEVKQLNHLMADMREQDFINNGFNDERLWLHRFIRCSYGHRKLRCFRSFPPPECNTTRMLINETDQLDLEPCLIQFARLHPPRARDGPIFNGAGDKVVGYRLELKTNFRYSSLFHVLAKYFEDGEDALQKMVDAAPLPHLRQGWTISGSVLANGQSLATLWYDLLNSVRTSTPLSVLCSVAVALVVVVISSRTFVTALLSVVTIIGIIATTVASISLMEWRLNIVESTIIILTVGLSFDFTLHYAVAYKLAPNGSRKSKVQHVYEMIGIPVMLSAVTTVAAGAAMCPSVTLAFYQIGLFMCLVTSFSYLYSSIFFMSLMSVFGPEETEWAYAKLCCDDDDDDDVIHKQQKKAQKFTERKTVIKKKRSSNKVGSVNHGMTIEPAEQMNSVEQSKHNEFTMSSITPQIISGDSSPNSSQETVMIPLDGQLFSESAASAYSDQISIENESNDSSLNRSLNIHKERSNTNSLNRSINTSKQNNGSENMNRVTVSDINNVANIEVTEQSSL